jgi:hypothetical protein
MRGSDQFVVRDITDINHPATLATPDLSGASSLPQFASGSGISYVNAFRELVWTPLNGFPRLVVVGTCEAPTVAAFGWSPDGQSFTYLVDPGSGASPSDFQWHLVSRAADRVIGNAPIWCYCGGDSPWDDFSLQVGFSPNGQLASLVEQVARSTDLQVRRFDGTLVASEIRGDGSTNAVTWGTWSGTDLFFRDAQGVERWRDGTIKAFLPGVAWFQSRASPGGGHIVYAVRGSDGFAHVSVVDAATGATQQLSSQPRTEPHFLTSRYVWYKGERPCRPGDVGICRTTTTSGITYVYDLQTKVESESIITDIADVWPHGG